MKSILSRAVALVLALTLPVAALPAEGARREKRARGASFEGTILEADGHGARDLTVVLTPLEPPGAEPVRGTTDRRGGFRLHPVPYGIYQVGFFRGEQGFPANRIVHIQPGKATEARFTLGPIEPQDAAAGVTPGAKVAGLAQPATGIARMEERLTPSGLAWLRTGRGVTTVVALSALLVGGIILLTGGDDEITPPPPATDPTGE